MTPGEFRRLALPLDGVEERSHMGHPDFRVGGRIFATLGYPDDRHGVVMMPPEDQGHLVRDHPDVFAAAAGKWGQSGSTCVRLAPAQRSIVKAALAAAWSRRVAKKPRPTPRFARNGR
jgi:hypothetical protein